MDLHFIFPKQYYFLFQNRKLKQITLQCYGLQRVEIVKINGTYYSFPDGNLPKEYLTWTQVTLVKFLT